ncbi:TPA: hypothetical protein ACU6JN_002326 [Salmonella enterica]|nr:hypothetical protein [Salmonella enterica]EAX7746759.1 hypothetical protein [Salmonella enterica]EAX7760523.1 hypothetical protein [Salmonella enterica]EBP1125747.1 hypothetical protein [Salmonella enterica]EBP1188731.1 hypothetical protein [Salmonella enterica]
MTTITREQAQKIIAAADEVITALAGTNDDVHPDNSLKMCGLWDDLNDRYAPPEVVRELARIALASMDAKPVYQYRERTYSEWQGCSERYYRVAKEMNAGLTRVLYTATPAPVVPDEIEPDSNNTYEYVDGWNACRTSMLQGKYRDLSQPVDPQISEYEKIMLRAGWVMVPVEPTDEMIAAALDSHLIVFNPVKTYSVMLAAAPQPETSDGK